MEEQLFSETFILYNINNIKLTNFNFQLEGFPYVSAEELFCGRIFLWNAFSLSNTAKVFMTIKHSMAIFLDFEYNIINTFQNHGVINNWHFRNPRIKQGSYSHRLTVKGSVLEKFDLNIIYRGKNRKCEDNSSRVEAYDHRQRDLK